MNSYLTSKYSGRIVKNYTVWLSFLSNAKAIKFILLPAAKFYNTQLNKGVPDGACVPHVPGSLLRLLTTGHLFTY